MYLNSATEGIRLDSIWVSFSKDSNAVRFLLLFPDLAKWQTLNIEFRKLLTPKKWFEILF